MTTYLILGYGVPRNILNDQSYGRYLPLAFNAIYDQTKDTNEYIQIICCGGATDCTRPPSDHTEAGEMIRYFEHFIAPRPYMTEVTQRWKFVAEDRSISTLENLLFAKEKVESTKRVAIICEQSRAQRIQVLGERIFAGLSIEIIPIDFDISVGHYTDTDKARIKEEKALAHDLWALASDQHLQEHHKTYEKKFAYLRENDGNLGELSKQWTEQFLKEIDTIVAT